MSFTKNGGKLMLIPHPYSGKEGTGRGIDEYCQFILSGLKKNKYENVEMMPPIMTNFSSVSILTSELRFAFKLRRLDGNVFHFLSPVGAKTATFIGKKPFIITVNDVIPFKVKGYHPLRYFILRRFIISSAKGASKIIVPFKFTKKFLINNLGIPESKIEVVNYWLGKEEGLRQYPKNSTNETVENYIIFFGSHNAIIRGGDTVLKVFKRVSESIPDLSLKMVLSLDSRDAKKLDNLARNLSISQKVQFIDFMDQERMNLEIANAAAVLYPSRLGYGYLFTKSISLGTPVISSTSLDMEDFEDVYGGLCQENDVSCFEEKIKKTLKDDEFRDMIKNQGKEVLKYFSSEQAIQKMIKIYQTYELH